MEIPSAYQIIDYRKPDSFKKQTFGNYQKSDVLNAFQKSIINMGIDEACHWLVELLVSGHIEEIWQKFFFIMAKSINIANPLLPQYIYYRYSQYLNITSGDNYQHDLIMRTRNNQEIRNHLAEITAILTLSNKHSFDKVPKIKTDDFRVENFRFLLDAVEYKLVDDIVMTEDPSELKLVANEIAFRLKEKCSSFNKCNYWIHWLLEWEKMNAKQANKFQCGARQKNYIKPQFYHDFIWLIWDVIFQELNQRRSPYQKQITTQIKALYEMYCYQFSVSNKKKKINLILQAMLYLTMEINWNQPIISNYQIVLQASANINLLFTDYKKLEQSKSATQPLPYQLKSFNDFIIPLADDLPKKKKKSNPKKMGKSRNKDEFMDSDSKKKMEEAFRIQNKIFGL